MPRRKVNKDMLELAKREFDSLCEDHDMQLEKEDEEYLESLITDDMSEEKKHEIRSATIGYGKVLYNYLGQIILVRKKKRPKREKKTVSSDKTKASPISVFDIIADAEEEEREDEVTDDTSMSSFASFSDESDDTDDDSPEVPSSSISSIEEILYRYKDDKDRIDASYRDKNKPVAASTQLFRQPDKKKQRKTKKELLQSMFNNSPVELDDEDAQNTLDTVYGKRFAPVVEFIVDTINEFDTIADGIQEELSSRPAAKSMYYTSQIANLISTRNSKLAAIKELTNISKTISDFEYKREKDKGKEDEDDLTKSFVFMGAQYLRGSLDNTMDGNKKNDDSSSSDKPKSKTQGKTPKKKKLSKKELKKLKKEEKKRKHSESSHPQSSTMVDDSEDDMMSVEVVKNEGNPEYKKMKSDEKDGKISNNDDIFNAIMKRRGSEITLNPYEQFIKLEGKYKFVVVADEKHPEKDWTFVAVDPKTGKKLKDFKKKYRVLVPDKSLCNMTFNFERMIALDKNTNKSYQLVIRSE